MKRSFFSWTSSHLRVHRVQAYGFERKEQSFSFFLKQRFQSGETVLAGAVILDFTVSRSMSQISFLSYN